jgi:hypothetical protein
MLKKFVPYLILYGQMYIDILFYHLACNKFMAVKNNLNQYQIDPVKLSSTLHEFISELNFTDFEFEYKLHTLLNVR